MCPLRGQSLESRLAAQRSVGRAIVVMTEGEISRVAAAVGFPLPEGYRTTMLAYPFSPQSVAADGYMLPNDPEAVISLNNGGAQPSGIARPFFVGNDLGEEMFFLDALKVDSPVYVYELETKKHRILADSWDAYLAHMRELDVEIAADEEAENQRLLTKRWWQFWR